MFDISYRLAMPCFICAVWQVFVLSITSFLASAHFIMWAIRSFLFMDIGPLADIWPIIVAAIFVAIVVWLCILKGIVHVVGRLIGNG